jgi:dihydroneopterin aldolase
MCIHIEDFKFRTIIGVFDSEREETQTVIVNAVIEYEYTGTYLHHVDVANLIKQDLVKNKYKVVEDALSTIVKKLKEEYKNIAKVNLKLTKPDYKAEYVFSASVQS